MLEKDLILQLTVYFAFSTETVCLKFKEYIKAIYRTFRIEYLVKY